MPAPLPARGPGAAAKMSVPVSTDSRPGPRVCCPRPGLRPEAACCRPNAAGAPGWGRGSPHLGLPGPGVGVSVGASPPSRPLCPCLSLHPLPGTGSVWVPCCPLREPPRTAGLTGAFVGPGKPLGRLGQAGVRAVPQNPLPHRDGQA